LITEKQSKLQTNYFLNKRQFTKGVCFDALFYGESLAS